MTHTQEELEYLLREWQATLRLQDWDVKVFIKRARDTGMNNVGGEVEWTFASRTAVICVLDPVDYNTAIAWPQDHEKTLVHELVHLTMAGFTPQSGTTEYSLHEQAVDSIAKALVSLKRKIPKEVNE